MEKLEIKSWIDLGYLHTRIIFEIVGKPKEHIEETIKKYVETITKSTTIKMISKEIAEAKEQEIPTETGGEEKEKIWSTFAEIEFLIKGVSNLVGFCFDYMPASVEILGPDKIIFNHHTITDFINDLQAKLHKMDAVLKNQNNENIFLKKNMQTTILNLLLVSLHNKKLKEEELSKLCGIPEEGLKPFIEILLKDNKIKKEEEYYYLS